MNEPRYSLWLRHLHWLVFLLVAVALALIYGHGWAPKGSALRASLKWSHMQVGIVILLLMLPRIVARIRSLAPPAIRPPLPRWQDLFAKTVHAALYLLLIAVPILGIITRMWDPADWDFLGIPLPHVPHPDKPTARQIQGIHETVGNVLMYLAAFHAAVGLFHHYVQRDNVLARMLPPSRRRVPAARADD